MASVFGNNFDEAQPSNLSLFTLPPYQTAVEKSSYEDVRTISQISSSSPIEFVITGQNGLQYVDLANTYMYVKCKITHNDGSNIGADEYVGPVNLTLQSLFNQVDVNFQGKPVTSETGHYGYKSMIQTILKYGSDAKLSQLTSQLWLNDVNGELDDSDVKTGANTSLFERSKYFTEGKMCDLAGPIMHDLFSLERYLLNQVSVSVKFYRSKPNFCLMTDEIKPDFGIQIVDMVLRVRKIDVNPAVIYAHAQALQKTKAKYPFVKCGVKTMSIPTGLVNFTWDNVFLGFKPRKCVVAFVNSIAVSGDYSLSPWNFQHYNITQVSISVDGIPCWGHPLRFNLNETEGVNTVEALMAMSISSGKWRKNEGNQITRDDISEGFALFAFDLEPSFAEQGCLSLLKQGNVRIDATFNSGLPHPVTCIVYSESQGYFELNAYRDLILG